MQSFKVLPYKLSNKTEWNKFVLENNQQTFLFYRDFMDYHSDRFEDYSLMIYEDDQLIGLLPANKVGDEVYSHLGLTYGGLLFCSDWNNSKSQYVFELVLSFLRDNQIKHLYIKSFPIFYDNATSKISKELVLNNKGKIYRTDKVLAIDYGMPFTIHKTKLKHYRKNKNKGFVIEEVGEFSSFWHKVLVPRLKNKHNVKPVHSLEEIELLKSRFPNEIKQFNISLNGEILAGITIFDKGNVVKSQYGATTDQGQKERAIEYLFLHLIFRFKDAGKHYFSMGTVTENNEIGYNKGLLKQKEELGCSVYLQDFYSLKLT